MPHYCVDTHPQEYGDRTVHDLTPGACPRLPLDAHQECLGWHADPDAAVRKARFRYKRASPCIYCCESESLHRRQPAEAKR